MERLLPAWAYRKEREFFQWRFLSVDDAVRFGVGMLILQLGLALVCGVFLGWIHGILLKFIGGGTGRVTILLRMFEAVIIAVWPLAMASRVAEKVEDGKEPSLYDILAFQNLFSLLFVMIFLFALAVIGALAFNQIAVLIWPNHISPVWGHFVETPSLPGVLSVYPLLFLGGLTLGTGFSFAPLVAIHEGGSPFEILSYSRHLARELKWAMLFLHGFCFITVSGALIVLAFLPNDASYTNDLIECSVISLVALLNGFVWNNAYGQALGLEKPHERFSVFRRKRFIVR